MLQAELAHLELLAEVDALVAELKSWAGSAPAWPAARQAAALVDRLAARADTLRVKLDAPLIVATLGGTGTGKSTLVNALVGADVSQSGRERPTTRWPTLICRSDLSPERLSIDPAKVHVVHRDLPMLRDLVLLDCPDPDTTEDSASDGTNLSRLRELLPHCDVLLVTTTQQKYRSARVAEELASSAPGARLVLVQTHADQDEDIREDWRRVLATEYHLGEIFLVDSLGALADVKAGLVPRGEFARLVEFLSRELTSTAAKRIRRANFLDLVEETLHACRQKIETSLPAIGQLEQSLSEQRLRLSAKIAAKMREELHGSRRTWENRLLGEIASRWGFSPFSCLLRGYQGLGGIVASAGMLRARTPAQMALWGGLEAGRRWRRRRVAKSADASTARVLAHGWQEGELRTASIIVDGYATEAGLSGDQADLAIVERQAAEAGAHFVAAVGSELQNLIGRLAARHTGWLTRWRYELALLLMLGVLLYRLGRNFFFDSWLAVELGWADRAAPVLGFDFFAAAAFWLVLWSALLIWAFTTRLRRGIASQIDALAEGWNSARLTANIFAGVEEQCRAVHAHRRRMERIEKRVTDLQQKLAAPESTLGHRIT